jgi:hypothetical protein
MITLTDPDLGTIELRSRPFVVTSFQISSRATRPVLRNRALADGAVDDTRYVGSRAVTIGLRLGEQPSCATEPSTMQDLYDRILPFMAPRRRPTLTWSLPGSGGVMRQMTVRGDSAPVVIKGSKYPELALQFVAPSGEITTPGEHVTTIDPASDVEDGRVYSTGSDLRFDRDYPATLAIGDRLITQNGNEPAHWTLAIFGGCVNPFFSINGATIDFSSNGGLTLTAGSSVVIDTRERTVYLDGDPSTSRYDRTNFAEWTWDELLLQPGGSLVRFGADTLTGGTAVLTYLDTWAG